MTGISAAFLAVAVMAGTAQSQQATLAIEHVTVLPMTRDTALVDHTVLVSGDRIMWIGPSRNAKVPRTARRIDGAGRFIIPGLADMHVHLDRREYLAAFLPAGITTVRNMRGAPIHLAWRDSIERRSLDGPVILTTGPSLRGRPGEGFVAVQGPDDAERVVRRQAGDGYDMIKVLYAISPEAYQRLTVVARELRVPVVGHVLREIGLDRALAAGQASLEHADGLFPLSFGARMKERLGSTGLSSKLLNDGNAPSELGRGARAIARKGAWVGTILSTRDGQCGAPSPATRQLVAALRAERVQLLAGSDVGMGSIGAGTGLQCELRTLVAAGLTPYEALVTATANAGQFAVQHLRSADIFGTIVAGARADLLMLQGNPRDDIRAVERPVMVVSRGQPVGGQ